MFFDLLNLFDGINGSMEFNLETNVRSFGSALGMTVYHFEEGEGWKGSSWCRYCNIEKANKRESDTSTLVMLSIAPLNFQSNQKLDHNFFPWQNGYSQSHLSWVVTK